MPRLARFLVLVLFVVAPRTYAAGISSCATDTSAATGAPQGVTFQTHRRGVIGVDLTARDIEFLWDNTYGSLSLDIRSTLDQFNQSIVFLQGTNPTAINAMNLQAVYNLLRREGSDWNPTDAADSTSYRVGRVSVNHTNADRAHTDLYIYNPEAAPSLPDGQWPSAFISDNEDVSSSRALTDVRTNNAVMIRGPAPAQAIDVAGTGWTSPNSKYQVRVLHEIQHSMPSSESGILTELWSAAAEAINGVRDTTRAGEIPYTWPLLAPSAVSPPLRGANSNYAARTSFMAYLAYNFPNADSARTLGGAADDLLVRWAKRPSRTFADLKSLLPDAECHTCANRTYFDEGASPLSARDRFNVLLHNWRAACFVNNPTAAERQFGFSTFSGFSPATQQLAWQDFDGDGTDDIVALPAIVTLGAQQLTRDLKLSGSRTFRGASFPMNIAPFAANYWVIRSDAALQTANRELVIRVMPNACYDCRTPSSKTLSVLASAIGYSIADASGDESVLWQNPGAVTFATPVQRVDVDDASSPIELVIPNFGLTTRSAVLVLSAGDGPNETFAGEVEHPYQEAVPYRLEIGIRSAVALSTNPYPLATSGTLVENSPSWSPANDELVFSQYDPNVLPGKPQLYRRKLDGSAPVQIGAQNLMQIVPSWSPRGDAIAYEGAVIGELHSDLWVAELGGSGSAVLRQLTQLPGCASMPSFQPNGQGLAYVHIPDPNSASPSCYLRWIRLDGSGDGQLALLGSPNNFTRRPRWSPDGKSIYVSLADQGDRIYSIPSTGGAFSIVNALPTPTRAFDLHAGAGRAAIETATPIVNSAYDYLGACPFGTPSTKPAKRIALLDTTVSPRDTSIRIAERLRTTGDPALATNGTLLAYRLDPAAGANTDVLVRQISWNRAPVFTGGVDDQSIPAAELFQVTLQATDADGEPITFKADYLPAGSTLYNGNVFRWQNPVGGTYFPVFRALDGSGGVDRRVVRISVTTEGGGGGPFEEGDGGCGVCLKSGPIATNGGPSSMSSSPVDEEEPRNSFLNGARSGAWRSQIARLSRVSSSPTGGPIVTLRAPLPGTVAVDRARLLFVDHDALAAAVATSAGIIVARLQPIAAITDESGGDWLTRLASALAEGGTLTVRAGSVLRLDLGAVGGVAGVALDCAHLGSGWGDESGIQVQGLMNGVWKTVDELSPRMSFDLLGVQLAGFTEARLRFRSDARVRGAWGLVLAPEPAGGWPVHPLQVTAVDPQTEPTSLVNVDGNSRMVLTSEALSMTFDAPPPIPTGFVRSHFLELRACYSPPASTSPASAGPADLVPPSRFALRQNQPNPTAGETTFRFEVPRTAHVLLEVFDTQGRRAALLVNSRFEPGTHSYVWDGRDSKGRPLGPGVYHYRMISDDFQEQRQMVVVAR